MKPHYRLFRTSTHIVLWSDRHTVEGEVTQTIDPTVAKIVRAALRPIHGLAIERAVNQSAQRELEHAGNE